MNMKCPYCNGVLGECDSRHLDAVFAEEVMGWKAYYSKHEPMWLLFPPFFVDHIGAEHSGWGEGRQGGYAQQDYKLPDFDLDAVMEGVEKFARFQSNYSFIDKCYTVSIDGSEVENSDLTIALKLACIEAVRRMKDEH